MELVNAAYKFKADNDEKKIVFADALKNVIMLLNPFAPHITEELAELCEMEALAKVEFPKLNEKALVKDEILIVVQVNGKLRDRLTLKADITKEEVEAAVREKDYSQFLKSGQIRKVIYVPGKLINVVG
jgi:leucyl-tRNA synthetase